MIHRALSTGALVALACIPTFVACSDDDKHSSAEPAQTAEGGQGGAAGSAGKGGAGGSHASGGSDALPALPSDLTLPIVFVHGFAGSAQQFDSQAQRFVANGFPAERLRAFEHDGAGTMVDQFASDLDGYIDDVRKEFDVEQVYLIGHSRGTSVSSLYLSKPEQAAKVKKYISLDGAGCMNIPIPCASPAQTTNTRPGQTNPIPGQKHVEISTSKESFAIQFEFLFDRKPEVLDIVAQHAPVVISGRAVNFPANTGRDGTHLDVWPIAADTGKRQGDDPLAGFDIGADGNWGPVEVKPDNYYEFILSTPGQPGGHHFYMQRFLRSSAFVRLLSGPPDSDSRVHSFTSADHTNLTVSRMREWTPDDTLEVGSSSKSGDSDAKNVISDATGANRIAIYLQDDPDSPKESTLNLLPWFPDQPFQTGVDLYLPASESSPDGTITLTNAPRGDMDHEQVLHVPNWPSSEHTISVMFADYPQP